MAQPRRCTYVRTTCIPGARQTIYVRNVVPVTRGSTQVFRCKYAGLSLKDTRLDRLCFHCRKGKKIVRMGGSNRRGAAALWALAPRGVAPKRNRSSSPTVGAFILTCTRHPQTHAELLSLARLVRKRPPVLLLKQAAYVVPIRQRAPRHTMRRTSLQHKKVRVER